MSNLESPINQTQRHVFVKWKEDEYLKGTIRTHMDTLFFIIWQLLYNHVLE